MVAGQVAVAENAHTAMRESGCAALEHDESREVLVFSAESIGDPCAGAGMPHERKAGVEKVIALSMFIDLGGHGADHRQLICALCKMGEQFADRQPAFPAGLEFPRRSHDIAIVVEHGGFDRNRHGLAVAPGQFRFWVKRIDMGNPAGHVGEDHPFGSWLEMRLRDRWLTKSPEYGVRSQTCKGKGSEAE